MRTVWAGALVIALVFIALLAAGNEASSRSPALPGADMAFIGSSLVRLAIPGDGPADGVFGDGRRHVRLTRSGATPRELTDFLAEAVAAGVPEIYVEVQPYVRTLKSDYRPSSASLVSGFVAPLEMPLWSFHRKIRASVLSWLGRNDQPDDSAQLEKIYDGSHEAFSNFYPVRFHPVREPEALIRALDEARHRGLRIVFMEMPLSQTLAGYLGEDFRREKATALHEFARNFDAEILSVASSWPDNHFSDRAHVNKVGRARFIRALQDIE